MSCLLYDKVREISNVRNKKVIVIVTDYYGNVYADMWGKYANVWFWLYYPEKFAILRKMAGIQDG